MNKELNLTNIFGDSFYLSSKKRVESLEKGAMLYGGATLYNNIPYSNFNEDSNFELKEANTVGIIVPTTYNVSEPIDNARYVEKVVEMLNYFGIKCNTENSKGSWYSNNEGVVIEDNTIVSWKCDKLNMKFNLQLLKSLATELKESMLQEAISIVVNEGIVIY